MKVRRLALALIHSVTCQFHTYSSQTKNPGTDKAVASIKGGVMVNFFDLILPDCKNELFFFGWGRNSQQSEVTREETKGGFFFL